MTDNPLLAAWNTPFDIPPFDQISDADVAPAFEVTFAQARAAINTVAENPDVPSFANTIEAMERADAALARVAAVFFNLASADTNDTLQSLQRDLSPKFAAFNAETMTNGPLFARVKSLFDTRESLGRTREQDRVLELYHRMFVRAGAELNDGGKARLGDVMQRLASLGTEFSQNVLADEVGWVMELGEDDLDGLPGFVVAAAKSAAEEKGKDGYIITLSRSLIVPFLQSSTRRDLRKKAYNAWIARGENTGPADNRPIVAETLKLREERAQLLGYKDFASFKLAPEMAKTPEAVRELLMAVWTPAKDAAEADAEKLTELMREDGINGNLEPWDWRYYAAILQKREHDLDETEIKPYLQLENMIEAAFHTATRLFGLSFKPLDASLYHDDVRAWEVRKGDRHMGVFIGDYFNRSSKRSGAWCSSFRSQSKLDGEIRPIVVNVCNFAKPPKGEPALLTFDDARTLFHEFGHALHGLMSDVTYEFVSGTSVARDFVELPSQLYEHWLSTPEILKKFALHTETGVPMPQDLLDRLLAAENFGQGFATVEYVASAVVDLDFHTNAASTDPMQAQFATLERLGMPNAITMRHATPHFQHVFSGDGYSSGYYSYMWSEVMDADAFAAFEETGDVFDPETAASLAQNIYSSGGSIAPDQLYLKFRGSMPKVEALLKQRGLNA